MSDVLVDQSSQNILRFKMSTFQFSKIIVDATLVPCHKTSSQRESQFAKSYQLIAIFHKVSISIQLSNIAILTFSTQLFACHSHS